MIHFQNTSIKTQGEKDTVIPGLQPVTLIKIERSVIRNWDGCVARLTFHTRSSGDSGLALSPDNDHRT